ncbi:MAG: ETC complex I subunit [Alphaproteobacteria bacterium]|nr:ETC complex I subunit [Alphaproteobacteria bacterium]
MSARIYVPAKTATQSGKAKTSRWLLEFEPSQAKQIDPLMGWTGSADMNQQVRLWFDTCEDAVAYAVRHGIDARVEEPKKPARKSLSYSENFRTSRQGQWTH